MKSALARHLYLTGFMSVGKTTIARALGKRLKVPVADLDELIEEEAQMSIPEIFAQHGERSFRTLEKKVLRQVSALPPRIVATGGGIVGQQSNIRLMRQTGTVVFLYAKLKTIRKRVRGSKAARPLFKPKEIPRLYNKRLPNYFRCDLVVDTEGIGVKEIVRWIIEYVERSSL